MIPRFLLAVVLLSCITAAEARDLDVGWISRLPRMDFLENPADPRRDGWPAEGQIVTWRAHVLHWDGEALQGVPYEWRLDGEPIANGIFDVQPGATTTVDLARPWHFERRRLEFVADPLGQVEESEEDNNALTVVTDAISVGFYAEQTLYDYFKVHQRDLRSDRNSFEDWAQRQIARMNEMYASAITLETPNGVHDRWRIDEVVVVPDGSLPGEVAPNLADKSVDLTWGFPTSVLSRYGQLPNGTYDARFRIDGVLLHEMNHVRYLVDVYLIQVLHDGKSKFVELRENGAAIPGTARMPARGSLLYETFENGLMKMQYTFVDRYSAGALNQIAGYRARGRTGNVMGHEHRGEFVDGCMPAKHRVRFVDSNGAALAGADVRVYRAEGGLPVQGTPPLWLTRYRDEADIHLTADGDGEILIEDNPFRKPGDTFETGGTRYLTGVAILRVEHKGNVSYLFFEMTAANRACFRGMRDEARYELVVDGNPCKRAPVLLGPAEGSNVPGSEVTLSWSKSPGAAGYLVFAEIDGAPPRVVAVTSETSAGIHIDGTSVNWSVVAEFDQCLRSVSLEGHFTVEPEPRRRRAVRP